MYGFHKVPHLQQGALKTTSGSGETELWEFRNDNFRRDHPELMSMVQRKGKVNQANEAAAVSTSTAAPTKIDEHTGALMATNQASTDFTGIANESNINSNNTNASNPSATSDQLIQLSTLFSAVQNIQRAQRGINDDLGKLNSSNNDLWREAIESRQRSKRQQDTINKMLRFLAGVFGAQEFSSDDGGVGVNVGGSGFRSTNSNSEGESEDGRKNSRGIVRRGGTGQLLIGDSAMAERQEQSSRNSKGKKKSTENRFGGGIEELELPYDQEEEMEDIPEHGE